MASRSLSDLIPEVQAKASALLIASADAGLDLLIYCTFRDLEEQARLYRNGRSLKAINQKIHQLTIDGHPDLATLLADTAPQKGKRKVTWAPPGFSYHNHGLAFDAVPLRDGKPVWGATRKQDLVLWNLYGQLAEDQGLEWSGRWKKSKREYAHAQSAGLSIQTILGFGD